MCEAQYQASPYQGAFGPLVRLERCSPRRKTIQGGEGSPDDKGSGTLLLDRQQYGAAVDSGESNILPNVRQ